MSRPPKNARDQLLAAARQRLLQAAADEFAREGYSGANINLISQAAGFAKGTVYNYFPSKRALLLTLVDEIAVAHTDAVQRQVKAESTAVRRLESFFRAGFAFVEEHPVQARTIVNIIYGPSRELREHVYAAYEPLFRLIMRDILKEGTARGEFARMNRDLVTALIMAIYLGSASQVDARGKIWLDPRAVTCFVLDGLRRRGQPCG